MGQVKWDYLGSQTQQESTVEEFIPKQC